MKARKLRLMCSAVALAAVLTGCAPAAASSASGTVTTQPGDDDPLFEKFKGELETNVTLQVLENDTAKSMGYLDELLGAFNTAYASYGIKAVDANIDQYTDLAQDGPAGYGPDVIYQANDLIMRYAEGRHVLPLPESMIAAEDEIPENAKKAYYGTFNDKQYTFGVPVNIQAPMMFYRKDMLPADYDQNNDGTPDMMESWNALYRYSQDIMAADPSKKGYMKALYDAYFASGYLFSYGAYIFGSDNTDPTDIGVNKGEAYKGAREIRQLAAIIGQISADDSINTIAEANIANGTYFATMTTPDLTTNFIKEMTAWYQDNDNLSAAAAKQKAEDNLVIGDLPKLPVSGDLTETDPELITMKSMGGINGYAVSSYTKAPKAALAFVNFATSYDMIRKRNEYLGIAPCRADVTADVGGVATGLFERLNDGDIYLMPSITAVAQIWTPLETLNKDLATDPFRSAGAQKYLTDGDFQAGLDRAAQQIADAINTLGGN